MSYASASLAVISGPRPDFIVIAPPPHLARVAARLVGGSVAVALGLWLALAAPGLLSDRSSTVSQSRMLTALR